MKKPLCRNCAFYIAYYMQMSSSYSKLNHGFCSKHQKSIKQFEICEDFKDNEIKEQRAESRRLAHLEQALTSITEIAQILKEKDQDKI